MTVRMWRHLCLAGLVASCITGPQALAQAQRLAPVTTDDLEHPDPAEWLSFSRTPDGQRYSPLDQIDRDNVSQLGLAWSRGLGTGALESIPIVHDGVMYMLTPRAVVQAVDATTGDLLWEFSALEDSSAGSSERSKTISIYGDVILMSGPESTMFGIDARTGELRWKTKAENRVHTSGTIVADGKVISGGACGNGDRDDCFVAAHDAVTGELIWKFNNVQTADDPPGFDTWGNAPLQGRLASAWGLPGSYDPKRRIVYWGIANPMPNTRIARHGGNADAVKRSTPSDLYSNSTVALDVDTGKLVWYFQHLPADDWDLDYTNERILLTSPFDPDPRYVKWINPRIPRGELHDMVAVIGEPGGIFALDADTGEFLWANPFPFDVDNFHIRDINIETGEVFPNYDVGFEAPGDHHVVCYWNTNSFWPSAYHPITNSIYVPWVDVCLDMTAGEPGRADIRVPAFRNENRDEFAGLAKIDMETGEIKHIYKGRAPGNGAVLATAGGLVFWGDLDRRFRAFDAETGEILWQTILGGSVQMSTITYAVDGRQYIAVYSGEGLLSAQLIDWAGITPARGHNAVYVFALPQ